MLWYPVGWTAGYLVLLVLVAAPLRRSGAYTLPDFAEARLGSRGAGRLLAARRGDRLALPAAAVPGRRPDPDLGDRRPALARRGRRRGRRPRQRDLGRHAQHHLRPGLPVLAQAHRAARPGGRAAGRVGGRRRPGPAGAAAAATAAWSMPLADGGGAGPLRDVLADHRDVPRHHGPAPRGRPLLHQPRRPGRPPYHARRAGPARALLPAAPGLRRARPALRRRSWPDRAARRPGAGAAAADGARARRRAAHRAGDRRRVRGVPVHVVGPDHRGRRRAHPGRHRRRFGGHGCRGVRPSGSARWWPCWCPCAVALAAPDVGVARTVGLAFAVAASTFCPLLVLGIWWRGLTDAGAIAGLLVGRARLGQRPSAGDPRVPARPPAGAPYSCSASPPPGACRPRCSPMVVGQPASRRTGSRPTPGGSWSGCTRRRRSRWTAAPTARRSIPTARRNPLAVRR